MGTLDQFAKATFATDTPDITAGAMVWEGPQEVGLTEVRLDGLLSVRDPGRVTGLPPPWNDAHRHADVVVEIKMPGDHLHPLAIRRAELRRAAWHVRRTEKQGPHWEGSVGLWHVAPHVPEVLRRLAELHPLAPGCYAIGSPSACSLWIAANELPLEDPLVPFLIARSGSKLVELAAWVVGRKPVGWIKDMLKMTTMDEATRREIMKQYPIVDPSPELVEQWRWLVNELVGQNLSLGGELAEKGRQEGERSEARKALRRVLGLRKLATGPEHEARIEACTDLPTLERWHAQAVTAASADEALT